MTVFCTFPEPPRDTWQTDPKLSGGGVLLHNGYKVIDQIVSNFGLAQQVYSLHTNQARDKQQRSYLTEDTAVITLKFSDTLVGNIITSRRSDMGPTQEYLRFYGKDKTLTINEKLLNIRDSQGENRALGVLDHAEISAAVARWISCRRAPQAFMRLKKRPKNWPIWSKASFPTPKPMKTN